MAGNLSRGPIFAVFADSVLTANIIDKDYLSMRIKSFKKFPLLW